MHDLFERTSRPGARAPLAVWLLGAGILAVWLLLGAAPARAADDPPTGFTYVIYYPDKPDVDLIERLQRNPLITRGLLQWVASLPDTPDRPSLQATWFDDVGTSYPPPDLQALQQFGRGLDGGQMAALSSARRALVLEFGHPQSKAIMALALADTLVGALLEDFGGLPVDVAMRRAISPQRWLTGRLQQASAQGPNVMDHVSLIAAGDGSSVRTVTAGMVKFGLPDLVVERVAESQVSAVTWLVNALAQRLIEGQRPNAEGWFDLQLAQIDQDTFQKALDDVVVPGAKGRGRFLLSPSARREGDPFNHLVAIGFGAYLGQDELTQRAAALNDLFGAKPAGKAAAQP
ncbi:MAG: hypothetical protein KDJ14_16085 [Xanthomonadales bacterium]|nr:hypothetical protein [Xanthomonadales bacterium]